MLSFPEWHPDCNLSASPCFMGGIFTVHSLAVWAILLCDIDTIAQLLLIAVVVICCVVSLLKDGLRWSRYAVKGFWYQDGQWYLKTSHLNINNTKVTPCRLSGGTVLGQYFISLQLKPISSRWHWGWVVFIPKDALKPDEFRRLQVFLRWRSDLL